MQDGSVVRGRHASCVRAPKFFLFFREPLITVLREVSGIRWCNLQYALEQNSRLIIWIPCSAPERELPEQLTLCHIS